MDHNKLWKIHQEMGIPDHLICLLRNLYSDQEETARTRHGTKDKFKIGKVEGEKVGGVTDFIFLESKIIQTVTAAMKLKET